MKYIYDSDIINSLIDVTEQIYYRYLDILDVKYKDDKYYYLIGELTRLSKIEDNILLSLPKASRLLDDVNICIKKIYRCNNYLMYNFILNRIDSNISNLCALAEDEELSNISNNYFIDSQYNINCINDNLYFNFILRLNNVIDSLNSIDDKRKVRFIQLMHIFSSKNISDAFINNNLCLEGNLIAKREDSYSDIESYNSFISLRNNISFNLCESLLMRNISLSKYCNNNLNNAFYLSNILLFKSLLQEVNDPDFMKIRKSFLIDYEKCENGNYVIDKLKSCFDLEYERRFSLNNDDCVQILDEDSFNNLINLLKIEETLYDNIINLKLDGFDNFELISSLIDFEKEVASELDINENNASIISSIIYKDLGFFIDVYDKLFKKDAIVQRLKNILDYYKISDLADGVLEKNYDSIMTNHVVDSLKLFNGNLSIVKYYLYMYPILTNDLVLMNGIYIDRFSDEVTSLSLGNNSVYDYYYDKSEQLYKIFTNIIDDLTRYSDLYECDWQNILDFKLCEISDIIDCVSDEHLCEIKNEVLSIDDGIIKNKILSLFKNKIY